MYCISNYRNYIYEKKEDTTMQRYAICDRGRLQAVGEQWKLLCARVATQLGQSAPLPPSFTLWLQLQHGSDIILLINSMKCHKKGGRRERRKQSAYLINKKNEKTLRQSTASVLPPPPLPFPIPPLDERCICQLLHLNEA